MAVVKRFHIQPFIKEAVYVTILACLLMGLVMLDKCLMDNELVYIL
jgi:hypothetical protein